jgi:hypothetical protein
MHSDRRTRASHRVPHHRDTSHAPTPPDNTTYWLSTKTRLKDPTVTLHREGCPILRISQRRTHGVLTGPLTWAQFAVLPAQGYQACGRCKPAAPSAAAP